MCHGSMTHFSRTILLCSAHCYSFAPPGKHAPGMYVLYYQGTVLQLDTKDCHSLHRLLLIAYRKAIHLGSSLKHYIRVLYIRYKYVCRCLFRKLLTILFPCNCEYHCCTRARLKLFIVQPRHCYYLTSRQN